MILILQWTGRKTSLSKSRVQKVFCHFLLQELFFAMLTFPQLLELLLLLICLVICKSCKHLVHCPKKLTTSWYKIDLLVILQGMVEPGDTVTNTLKKEFGEEALNSLELSTEENKLLHKKLEDLFSHGNLVTL